MVEQQGYVHLDGWAGRAKFRVTVLETLKRSYRVRFEEKGQYGRWSRAEGSVGLVPRRAVTIEPWSTDATDRTS